MQEAVHAWSTKRYIWKYGNVRTGLKFDEFQTKFHLHHQYFSHKDVGYVCGVCVNDYMHVALVQLACEVTVDWL